MNRLFSLLIVCSFSLFVLTSCGDDSSASQTAENKVEKAKAMAATTAPSEAVKATPVVEKEVKDAGPLELSVPEVDPKEVAATKKAAKETVEVTEKKVASATTKKSSAAKKSKPKPSRKKAAKIDFEYTDHAFGLINQGEEISHRFEFTNTGQEDLVISNVTATCGCTQPSYPFVPIKPGETGYIGVTYNSKGKLGRQKPTLTVYTNAQPKTYKLYLEGVVDAPRAPKPEETKTEEGKEGLNQN